jgi:hypothetical protein
MNMFAMGSNVEPEPVFERQLLKSTQEKDSEELAPVWIECNPVELVSCPPVTSDVR